MKMISYASLKGGVGKTAACANVAYALSKKKKILVVDLDPQSGLTHNLGSRFKSYNCEISDFLKGEVSFDDCIHEYWGNLHIIPTTFILYQFSLNGGFRDKLEKALDGIKDKYDFVFFDLAPAVSFSSLTPLMISDYVIVPVECSGAISLLGLTNLENIIKIEIERESKKIDLLGILPTFHDRTKVSKEVFDYLNEKYGEHVLPKIRRNAAIAQASSIGKSVLEHRSTSNGAKDYQKLADDILSRLQPKKKKKKKGA